MTEVGAPAGRVAGPAFKHEISAGVKISGRLSFPGDARIDGQLRGEVRAHALLVVGPEAVLRAEVRARRLVVQGTIVGNVHASARLEIEAGARLIGDVEAEHLVVHEGALLEGRCQVGPVSRGASRSDRAPEPAARRS